MRHILTYSLLMDPIQTFRQWHLQDECDSEKMPGKSGLFTKNPGKLNMADKRGIVSKNNRIP